MKRTIRTHLYQAAFTLLAFATAGSIQAQTGDAVPATAQPAPTAAPAPAAPAPTAAPAPAAPAPAAKAPAKADESKLDDKGSMSKASARITEKPLEADKKCIVKPVMTDDEIRLCSARPQSEEALAKEAKAQKPKKGKKSKKAKKEASGSMQ